jgi:hypothetical protein
MMALQVIPMIACDKEKEWRVDTLESLPSFYQRPKIWLLWFVLLSSDP